MEKKSGPRAVGAVFTIVSNNYLHFARTLMMSVRLHEPGVDRYVMVLDKPVVDEARGDKKLYTLIELDQIDLPDRHQLLFRYNIMEANTAVKPWVFEFLSRTCGYESVVYLDPDIYLYRPLEHVREALSAGASLVLIPHLMEPISDDKHPSEIDILQAGAYNLGFAAIGEWGRGGPIIKWWQAHLERDCVVDPAKGLFVDQRWMDLAPGMFPDVSILRHKGYDVAYWNLHERPVQKSDGQWLAGGVPLHFFHFSGLNVDNPAPFSKHQDRFRLRDIGDAKELVDRYCERLKQNGADRFKDMAYGFSRQESGTPISDFIRRLYRNDEELQAAWGGNPFRVDMAPLLNQSLPHDSVEPHLTRLMRWIWRERKDLQLAFPDIEGADRHDFVGWYCHEAEEALDLPDTLIETARAQLEKARQTETEARPATLVSELVELFQLHDEVFVCRAYQIILRRPVDESGLREFTGRLRRRKIGRQRLVWALAFSPEGRALRRPLGQRFLCFLPVPLLKLFSAHRSSAVGITQDAMAKMQTSSKARAQRLSTLGARGSDDAIRIVGYFEMQTGVGESARRGVATVQAAGYRVDEWIVRPGRIIESRRSNDDGKEETPADPDVSILHINADQVPVLGSALDVTDAGNSYRIGYWHWEMPQFPSKYFKAFQYVDEVWVPSDYMLEALRPVAPVPVQKIPHSIEVPGDTRADRKAFSIPKAAFAFLVIYDTHSYQERKNPLGAIEAYLRAFPRASKDQCLVIKANNPDFDEDSFQRLFEATQGREDMILVTESLDRQQLYDLEASIDCMVSLHRSEGFGLCPAECMYLGKSVIATGWSGNMEFMNDKNSYLVNYALKTLTEDVGPYEKGQYWADPELDHAVHWMRHVMTDVADRQEKVRAAAETIRTHFSPTAIGERYRCRLDALLGLGRILVS